MNIDSFFWIVGAYGHIHTPEGKDISGNLMAIDISRKKKININQEHYVKIEDKNYKTMPTYYISLPSKSHHNLQKRSFI